MPDASAPNGAAPLPLALRRLHWASAALLVAMFALAWTFEALGPSDLGAALVDWHRSFGLLLLAVVIARLVWRLTHKVEPIPPGIPAWERWLAAAVQGALYLLLVAMPLLGWAASAATGDVVRAFGLPLPEILPMDEDLGDRLFQIHGTLAWVLLALVALHVAGAVRHHFVHRDGLLARMRIG
ncbi:cytochrome b [Aureimonas sp. ME7]|uniref:cytochrome b n=1 Tax=Aureimonas sp. ME7 TaxID=2744252 RepID=UPI0015F586BB|nr:cytochrome b [Aureimonas sp. ME7]